MPRANRRQQDKRGNDVQSVSGRHTAYLDHRLAAAAGLVHRGAGLEELPRGDGQFALSRAVRGRRLLLPARAGDRRPRHRDRRRCPLRRRGRGHELAELSAHPHGRLRRAGRADALQGGRGRLSARPYPARFPRGARVPPHRRAGGARTPAIHGDVEGGAAHDQAAGQVRHHPARADRGFGRGRPLQGPGRAHLGDQQRAQRGAHRARRPPAVRCSRWRSRRSTWCRRAARPSASSTSTIS